MSYHTDTQTALVESEAINGIVFGRVFADVADGSATAPYLVYQFVSEGGETTHDGSRGVVFPLIQISCWATTKSGAITLGDAVKETLEGQTIEGDSGASFQHSDRFGTYEDDTKLYGEIIEYRMAATLT